MLEKFDIARNILEDSKNDMPADIYEYWSQLCEDRQTIFRNEMFYNSDFEKLEDYMMSGENKKALKHILAMYKRETDVMLKDNMRPMLAMCLVMCNRLQKGLKVINQCTIEIPSVFRERAQIYQKIGDFNSASEWWKKANEINIMSAIALYKTGKMTEALKQCKKLEKSGDTTPLIYDMMRKIYKLQKNRKEEEKYNELFMRNPQEIAMFEF